MIWSTVSHSPASQSPARKGGFEADCQEAHTEATAEIWTHLTTKCDARPLGCYLTLCDTYTFCHGNVTSLGSWCHTEGHRSALTSSLSTCLANLGPELSEALETNCLRTFCLCLWSDLISKRHQAWSSKNTCTLRFLSKRSELGGKPWLGLRKTSVINMHF